MNDAAIGDATRPQPTPVDLTGIVPNHAAQETPEQLLSTSVAETAAGVKGVHHLGGTVQRTLDRARRQVLGTSTAPGVNVSTEDGTTVIDLDVVVDYPNRIDDVIDETRVQVTHAARQLVTGPVGVNITVTDIHGPFDQDPAILDAIDRAGEKTRDLRDQAGERAAHLSARAGEGFSELKGRASDMASQAAATATDLQDQADVKVSEMKEKASELKEQVGDTASDLRDRAGDAAAAAGERVDEFAAKADAKVAAFQDVAEQKVDEAVESASDASPTAADDLERLDATAEQKLDELDAKADEKLDELDDVVEAERPAVERPAGEPRP